MNNDLISRSKLKDKLKINFSRKPEAQAIYQHLIDIVDDCPTVKTPIIYEFKGCDNCELERPKGEWVKSKDGYTRCDQCGSRGSAIKARFCHHCGADMRKGGAE